MSFSFGWRGPNIVRDNLVVYLNASSPNSYYDKTSTTNYKDLTGNGRNSTLVNGPFLNKSYNGGLSFDGVDDYAEGVQSVSELLTDSITIISVASISDLSQRGVIFSTYRSSSAGFKLEIGTIPGLWTDTMRFFACDDFLLDATDLRGTVPLNQNQIYMFTATYNSSIPETKMYYNLTQMPATQAGPDANTSGWSQNPGPYYISSFLPDFPSSQTAPMIQYNCLIYNRVLSFEEITQNYNSFKPIYNL
jgi:hypothetical protein